MPIICPQCGKSIEPTWIYCGYCGQELTQTTQIPNKPGERKTKNFPKLVKENRFIKIWVFFVKKHRVITFWGICGLFILAVLILFTFWNNGNGGFIAQSTNIFSPPKMMSFEKDGKTPMFSPDEIETTLAGNPSLKPFQTPSFETPISSDRSDSGDEITKANQAFSQGNIVYLYNPQPDTVSISNLNNTVFTLHYILSNNAAPAKNVSFIVKGNVWGEKEYIVADRATIDDWGPLTGVILIDMNNVTTSLISKEKTQQAKDPLFLKTPEIESPDYLDIQLLVRDDIHGKIYVSDSTRRLSNIIRITVTGR